MANIAQVVNVLQSMILTKGKEMVLTPSYYVFKMYKVHQDATYLPIDLECEKMNVRDNRTDGKRHSLQRQKRCYPYFPFKRKCR